MLESLKRMKKIRIPYNRKPKINVFITELKVENTVYKSVYKSPFKLMKLFWCGEISDPDFFNPSCPHLHSLDGKYKLNVYNGELYDIRLKRVAGNKHVSKEELDKLWKEPKFLAFANSMRNRYFEQYPCSKLPDIPLSKI